MSQLHKRFTAVQVKEILQRYMRHEIERSYVQEILKIGKTRLFALVKSYRQNPESFSLQYERPGRSIDPAIEKNIFKELTLEKKLIQNKDVPLNAYRLPTIRPFPCRPSLTAPKKKGSISKNRNAPPMTAKW